MANGDTKLNICSRALFAIGADEITSFEDGTIESRISKAKYDIAKQDLLSIYFWTFALKETYIARVSDTDNLKLYKYLYQLPNDCLRVITIRDGNIKNIPYTFRNSKINTDLEQPILQYISDVDEAVMPSYFVNLLINRLARDILIPITAKNDDYALFENIYQQNLTTAKHADAQTKTVSIMDTSRLLRVR